VVAGRRAVLDTFVRAGVINFSKFERHVEFIRADGRFVFIMGLKVEPVTDAPSAGLVAGHAQASLHEYLEERRGVWLFARHAKVIAIVDPTAERRSVLPNALSTASLTSAPGVGGVQPLAR
jgi:hypothetical protein